MSAINKITEVAEKLTKEYSEDERYLETLDWAIKRAEHYESITGLEKDEVIRIWEEQRTYSFLNFYQDSNQPLLDTDSKNIRVFKTLEDAKEKIEGKKGFRCPSCNGVSKDPYSCDTKIKRSNGEVCNWSAFGLFSPEITVIIIDGLKVINIFTPIAWEDKTESEK